ncbi:hypothetical protein AVEN_259201-1 [Araneus ventricosus]|uniref:HAT C-terminal dimerisation domain-containing protein n=1 Tax=Araneus ventricosus TaxID=182803 RepID=A0A4Y2GP73_ARAVE|nr:hypothetical protein AVEN_259201-1 [Araneus ventricosus]
MNYTLSEIVKKVLQLFGSKENRLSNIIKLAEALKTIPPTSTEAERTFSAAGLFITKLRTRLNDESIDCLCFANSTKSFHQSQSSIIIFYLYKISNTNSQQITNNDSTELSIVLSSSADQLALQRKLQSRSSRSTHSTQYRSASNSLLTRTADRTPKRDSKDVRTPRRSQSINTFKVDSHSLTQ